MKTVSVRRLVLYVLIALATVGGAAPGASAALSGEPTVRAEHRAANVASSTRALTVRLAR